MPDTPSSVAARASARMWPGSCQLAAERAGLSSNITAGEAEIALEIVGAGPDGEDLRIVVRFNDARDGVPGWCDWITLSAETAGERTPLLTLAWRDDERLTGEENLERRLAEWEARIDRELPPGSRGLNAKADVRTGRYGRGSVLAALLRDLQSAAGAARGHEPRAVALRAEPVTVLRREGQSAQALPVIEVSAEPVSPPAQILNPMSAAAVSERLIAAVLQTHAKGASRTRGAFCGRGCDLFGKGARQRCHGVGDAGGCLRRRSQNQSGRHGLDFQNGGRKLALRAGGARC